jgi:hypothetical protein
MPKKISEWSKAQLVAVDLPTHGDSYTVISHQSVIDYVYTELAVAGFGVVSETFRATADGQIAHGIHVLQYQSDPELSMMFAWTNSYNKQVRFKCGVGAYVNQAGTFMVHGDMGSWARKHTGTADEETVETIKGQIKDAQMYYDQLKSDKDAMKEIKMNKRKQAQLLGILFAEYQILTTEQANIVRSEMIKPTHVFEDTSSLWAFYNYVTGALQTSHPKTWMEDQRVLHYFISSVNNFSKPSVPQPVIEAEVDPLAINYGQPKNQLNILTEIEKTEAVEDSLELEANSDLSKFKKDLDIDDSNLDELVNESIEETVSYTDPMGNTFEAPIVIDSIDLNSETKMAVIITSTKLEDDSFMDGIDETVEPVKSLEPTPEDLELFEATELSEGTSAEANLDAIVVNKNEDLDFTFSVDDEDDDSSFF